LERSSDLRAARRDIAEFADQQVKPPDMDFFAARMLDRISLTAPRLASSTAPSPDASQLMRELRIVANIAELRRQSPPEDDQRVAALMQQLTALFRNMAHDNVAEPPPAGLEEIDRLLDGAMARGNVSQGILDIVDALTGYVGNSIQRRSHSCLA
jgi:hypothetical protein